MLNWETSTALKVLKTGEAVVNQPRVMQLGDELRLTSLTLLFL
ncbi:hypothetical protein [Halanaerobium congolense]|nr:hypothetical protein [Halanaerobium congolense]